MKRIRIHLALIAAAVLLTGSTGCQYLTARGKDAGEETQAIRVATLKLERKNLRRTTTQPARIEAYEETPLFARIDGYVEKVAVDIGDVVEKDQVLAKVYVPEMEKELLQKQALVRQAKAEVEQAEQKIQVANQTVEFAKARVAEAEAAIGRAMGDHERWKSEHARIRNLAAGGSISNKLVDETLQQLQSADAALKEANAKVTSAKAALNQSLANIEQAKADHAANVARLAVAEAGVEHMQTLLEYATIRAPFAGKVTQRNINPGHLVSANSKSNRPLFVVASTEKIRIFLDVPESEASLIKVGQPVSIRIPSLRGRTIEGDNSEGNPGPKVTRTSWALQKPARTLRTEIELPMDEKTKDLLPGMYAIVTVILEERSQALSLPLTAIAKGPDGKEYCCCVADGKIVKTNITPGLRLGEQVEILSGLDGDETVVAAHMASLQDGQAVSMDKKE